MTIIDYINELIINHLNIQICLNVFNIFTTIVSIITTFVTIPKLKKNLRREQQLIKFTQESDSFIKILKEQQIAISNNAFNKYREFQFNTNSQLRHIMTSFPDLLSKQLINKITLYKEQLKVCMYLDVIPQTKQFDLSDKLIEIISLLEGTI